MATALLSRSTVCLPQKAGSRRTARPAAFTPVRRVVLARAQPKDDDDVEQLMDAEEDFEDIEVEDMDEVDAETLANARAIEEYVNHFSDAALYEEDVAAEVLSAEGDKDLLEAVKNAREAVLEDMMDESAMSEEAADLAIALAEEDGEAAEVEPQDVQIVSSGKYDEEADGLTADDKEAVAPFKLSKGELKNLLPKDWDTMNTEWVQSARKEDTIPLPEYRLNFLWLDQNIAVAVDQVFSRGQTAPLTEYFFWPRKDAWEELKGSLEARPWISDRDKVILLNRCTEVINAWQNEERPRPKVHEAASQFPDCVFASS